MGRGIERTHELQRVILAKVAAGAPADEVIDSLCVLVERARGGGVCAHMRFDPATGLLRVRGAPSAPPALLERWHKPSPEEHANWCGICIERGELVMVEDTLTDTNWADMRDVADELGVRSHWALPISDHGGRRLGTLTISNARPGLPTSEDLSLFKAARDLAGIVLTREQAQDVLRRKEELLRCVVESTHDAVLAKDASGRILLANSAALALLGAEASDVIGKTAHDVLPNDEALAEERTDRHVLDKGLDLQYEGERGPPGHRRLFHVRKNPLIGADGKIDGVIGVAREVTGLKKREEAVRRAQKLESLGVLAGGIVHDFNNILTGILGNAELALSDSLDNERVARNLEEILRAAKRATDLTSQILTYTGRSELDKRVIALPTIVEAETELIASSISRRASLRFQVDPGLPNIEADPTQVRQVVMNLLLNASESLEGEPGEINVEIHRRTQLDGLDLVLRPEELCPEGYVELCVGDTGAGIDPETIELIFDPFFTTKFTGRGLGLATVRGIVSGHGGALAVRSEPGRGTTFCVLWPASDRQDLGEEVLFSMTGWRGSGRILVADDEAPIRKLARRILQQAGFEVVLAQDGQHAIEIMEADGDGIDAILLDLTMPRMRAPGVMSRVAEIYPGLPIVVASGYSEEAAHEELDELLPSAFLQKPFGRSELLTVMRRVLERH